MFRTKSLDNLRHVSGLVVRGLDNLHEFIGSNVNATGVLKTIP